MAFLPGFRFLLAFGARNLWDRTDAAKARRTAAVDRLLRTPHNEAEVRIMVLPSSNPPR
jgi:hypothetical protein